MCCTSVVRLIDMLHDVVRFTDVSKIKLCNVPTAPKLSNDIRNPARRLNVRIYPLLYHRYFFRIIAAVTILNTI